ncbi:MAG TPA: peptide deformylase, partial [Candidatus Jacksonbacteria bacterium]|nr:peptide deformylase [Candidatus Jacksonbacteria bacterium]
HTLLEGCLSCPKVERPVARAIWVKVRAQDITGKNLEFDAENLSARVIQHELDHLDGILIIDK